MNRRRLRSLTLAARLHSHGGALERMARGDLGLAPPVHELTGADAGASTRGGALHPQHVEPGLIDRLEGQGVLKTCLRGSVDLSRGANASIAVE